MSREWNGVFSRSFFEVGIYYFAKLSTGAFEIFYFFRIFHIFTSDSKAYF